MAQTFGVKYRPDTLDKLVGQKSIIQILEQQLKLRQFKNCYLFTGSTGIGKTTISRAFANARKAGKQTFNWNGKSYTTQLAGEKKNNTSEKTYNTTKLTNNRLIDNKETTKLLINTIPSSSSVIPKSNTLNIADNNGYYDRINMMKCGGKRKMKCGGKCNKK